MPEGRKGGAVAALEGLAGEIGAPPTAAGEQLSLLPGAASEARKPGRPAGSQNSSTKEWQRYLLGRYGSPLERLATIVAMPLQQVCKELKCDLVEAHDRQVEAAKALAPYVHQRLPQAVELSTDGDVVLNLVIGGQQQQAEKSDGITLEVEENQELSVLPDLDLDSGDLDDRGQMADLIEEKVVAGADRKSAVAASIGSEEEAGGVASTARPGADPAGGEPQAEPSSATPSPARDTGGLKSDEQ